MKRVISWFVVALGLALVMTVTIWSQEPLATPETSQVLVGEGDNGGQVDLKENQVLVVELDGNPSTGYMWEVDGLDQTSLRQVGPSTFQQGSRLLGAPEKQTVLLQALRAGEASLNLSYRRAWETHAPPAEAGAASRILSALLPWQQGAVSGQPARTFSLQIRAVGPYAGVKQLAPPAMPSLAVDSQAIAAPAADAGALALPSHFSWCENGGCTPVKDQRSCGSCWAFATVGVLESQLKIKDGVTKDLSEQYLLSCNSDSWTCSGGWWAHDYHQWKVPSGEPGAGAVYEGNFPYVGNMALCNPPHTHNEKITSWQYVGGDESIPSVAAIKQAIYDHGPVGVAVCAGGNMQNYGGGIFRTADTCLQDVNHAVVLVGWDDTDGAWYLKNSWGTGWGESIPGSGTKGYMRIQYGVAMVGFSANYVVYPGSVQTPTPTRTPTATPTKTSTSVPTNTSTPIPPEVPTEAPTDPAVPPEVPTVTPRPLNNKAYLPLVKIVAAPVIPTETPINQATPTPTPTTQSRSVEMIQNGGFESGRVVWTESSAGGYQIVYPGEQPRTGNWSAWLGGYTNANDQLYQNFTVPSWARGAQLRYYYYVQSEDSTWVPADYFYGELQDQAGTTLNTFTQINNTNAGPGWYQVSYNWSAFASHAGKGRRLSFRATTNGSLNTNFFVDDVSFVAFSGTLPAEGLVIRKLTPGENDLGQPVLVRTKG